MEEVVNFSVLKQKIIKTDEVLLMYVKAQKQLKKIQPAYKQIKSDYANTLNEVNLLKLDNERMSFSLSTLKTKHDSIQVENKDLKDQFAKLEQKYNQQAVMMQSACQELEEEINGYKLQLQLRSPTKPKSPKNGSQSNKVNKELGKDLNALKQAQIAKDKEIAKLKLASEKIGRQHNEELSRVKAENERLLNESKMLETKNNSSHNQLSDSELNDKCKSLKNKLKKIQHEKNLEIQALTEKMNLIEFDSNKVIESIREDNKKLKLKLPGKPQSKSVKIQTENYNNDRDCTNCAAAKIEEKLKQLDTDSSEDFCISYKNRLVHHAKSPLRKFQTENNNKNKLNWDEDKMLSDDEISVQGLLKEMTFMPFALSPMYETSSNGFEMEEDTSHPISKEIQQITEEIQPFLGEIDHEIPQIIITPPTPNVSNKITDFELFKHSLVKEDIPQIPPTKEPEEAKEENPNEIRWEARRVFRKMVKLRLKPKVKKRIILRKKIAERQKNDELLEVLKTLTKSNINFFISNESPVAIPWASNFQRIPSPIYENPFTNNLKMPEKYQNHNKYFTEKLTCLSKCCCEKQSMMLLNNDKNGEFLGFFDVKSEILTPCVSRLENRIDYKPFELNNTANHNVTSERVLNTLAQMVGEKIKESNNYPKRKKRISRKVNYDSLFSETESELERLHHKTPKKFGKFKNLRNVVPKLPRKPELEEQESLESASEASSMESNTESRLEQNISEKNQKMEVERVEILPSEEILYRKSPKKMDKFKNLTKPLRKPELEEEEMEESLESASEALSMECNRESRLEQNISEENQKMEVERIKISPEGIWRHKSPKKLKNLRNGLPKLAQKPELKPEEMEESLENASDVSSVENNIQSRLKRISSEEENQKMVVERVATSSPEGILSIKPLNEKSPGKISPVKLLENENSPNGSDIFTAFVCPNLISPMRSSDGSVVGTPTRRSSRKNVLPLIESPPIKNSSENSACPDLISPLRSNSSSLVGTPTRRSSRIQKRLSKDHQLKTSNKNLSPPIDKTLLSPISRKQSVNERLFGSSTSSESDLGCENGVSPQKNLPTLEKTRSTSKEPSPERNEALNRLKSSSLGNSSEKLQKRRILGEKQKAVDSLTTSDNEFDWLRKLTPLKRKLARLGSNEDLNYLETTSATEQVEESADNMENQRVVNENQKTLESSSDSDEGVEISPVKCKRGRPKLKKSNKTRGKSEIETLEPKEKVLDQLVPQAFSPVSTCSKKINIVQNIVISAHEKPFDLITKNDLQIPSKSNDCNSNCDRNWSESTNSNAVNNEKIVEVIPAVTFKRPVRLVRPMPNFKPVFESNVSKEHNAGVTEIKDSKDQVFFNYDGLEILLTKKRIAHKPSQPNSQPQPAQKLDVENFQRKVQQNEPQVFVLDKIMLDVKPPGGFGEACDIVSSPKIVQENVKPLGGFEEACDVVSSPKIAQEDVKPLGGFEEACDVISFPKIVEDVQHSDDFGEACDINFSPQSPDSEENKGLVTTKTKIIPLDKCRLKESKVVVLFDKLVKFSKEEKVVEEVVEHFITQDAKYICQLILTWISQDTDKPAPNYNPHAPLLTETQRIFLGFMATLEKKHNISNVFDTFLTQAEAKLFTSCELVEVAPITKLYLSICKLRKDLNRIRRFCCEAFYFMKDLAIPLFFTVLTSWIEVMPKESEVNEYPIAKVLVQIIHLKDCSMAGFNLIPLRRLLVDYYGYPSERWYNEEVFKEIYDNYLRNPVKSSDLAILLLFKNTPTKWVYQKIKEHFFPLIEKIPTENFKATVIILIGYICSQFDKFNEYDLKVINEIREELLGLVNDSTPSLVKQSIYLTLQRIPRPKAPPNPTEK